MVSERNPQYSNGVCMLITYRKKKRATMFAKDSLNYSEIPLPDRADMTDAEMSDAALAFLDTMRTRHSVRDYTDRPVARDVIENCIRTAGSAPSGANHQPWHFVAIANPALKQKIREEAEIEERKFYAGGGGDEWIKALEPIGTDANKPHLTIAPWLIIVFAQRWGEFDDGTRYKNYYVPRKRQHRHRIFAGRPASRRAGDTDPHAQPNEIFEQRIGTAQFRKTNNDHCGGSRSRGCQGAGRGKGEETAGRYFDIFGIDICSLVEGLR